MHRPMIRGGANNTMALNFLAGGDKSWTLLDTENKYLYPQVASVISRSLGLLMLCMSHDLSLSGMAPNPGAIQYTSLPKTDQRYC